MKRILFLCFAAIIASCTSHNVREVDGMLVLNVEDVKQERDIPVSRLAESVEVIPLENADDAFLEFASAVFSEHYVVVKAHNKTMRIFTRDGRFVGKMDELGEYQFVHDMVIDEKCEAIYASIVGGDSIAVFGLDGRTKPAIHLPAPLTKAVLNVGEKGLELAQFDFCDHPCGFNAAVVGNMGNSFSARSSLSAPLVENGMAVGFNHDIFGSRMGGRLTFMTTFCDTLFRLESGRIVPELAVNMKGRQMANTWELMQEPEQELSWMIATTLPRHYLVHTSCINSRNIIIDRQERKAFLGRVLCDLPGCEDVEVRYADNYAYIVVPPVDNANATIVRWRLGDSSTAHAVDYAALPAIPTGSTSTNKAATDAAADSAFVIMSHTPVEALRTIDTAIAHSGLKRGHPALAYAYAVKSTILTQMEMEDSARTYQRLINAPLTNKQERDINERMMHVLTCLGDFREAQRYAIAYGVTSDMAQGTQYLMRLTENRVQITELDQQIAEGSRTRAWLIAALVAIAAASPLLIIYMRRRRRQHLATHRELLTNHAVIRRIRAAPQHPLSEKEEKTLHRVVAMLYPNLAERLQQQAATPLSSRELTICYLIRLGVPQPNIASLLDWKPATYRVAKSRLKRDRLQLPADAELEDFVCGL